MESRPAKFELLLRVTRSLAQLRSIDHQSYLKHANVMMPGTITK